MRKLQGGLQQMELHLIGSAAVSGAFDLFESGRSKPCCGITVDFGRHVLLRSGEEGVSVHGRQVTQLLREVGAGHC